MSLAGLKVFCQLVVDLVQRLSLVLESFHFLVCLLSLSGPDLLSVLCVFKVLNVVVVLDYFSLDALLDVSVLSLVLVVQKAQFSHGFLQVSVLLLSLFNSKFDVSEVVAALIHGGVKLVVLVLVALDLFP